MPSPVGHSLIGLAIGSAWLLPRGPLRDIARRVWSIRLPLAVAVLVANLPDIDFIPGLLSGDLNRYHHLYTHSVGFVLIVAMLGDWTWRRLGGHPRHVGLFLLALASSHLVADLFITDTKPPYGIMALWPFSREWFLAPVALFPPLQKASPADAWQWANVRAGLIEAALTAPLVMIAWWARSLVREPAPRWAGDAEPVETP